MHQSVGPGAESQHLDGLSTQKRHAGGIGFGVKAAETGLSEVGAQVFAYLVRDLCHSVAGGAAMVRFIPESASKTASFVVSQATSIDCPRAAFDSAGTLATN